MAILIDGYNLLYVAGMGVGGTAPGTLQRARNALLACLAASLEAEERAMTTVVFDAQDPPPNRPHEYHSQGICVKYAVGYADADSLLEELIQSDSAPRRLTVVSSDHRVQRAARRRRATAVDSDVWFDRLGQRRAPRTPSAADASAKPIERPSEGETKRWLEIFATASDPEPKSEDVDSGAAASEEVEPLDNPFPPGYADDLLDE